MVWISSVTGYVVPPPPVVKYVSENKISIIYCHKIKESCKLGGLFYFGSNTVFVNKDQTPEGREAVLVHELTHYMQSRNHEYSGTSCEDTVNRELDAYTVEQKYAKYKHFRFSHGGIKIPKEVNLNLCKKKGS